ncbi:uncharacterized protein J3D65DRAFT_310773 [Phyllosticta citribraziliensis]|uniref:Uncharacterized protein n=1 Tax=Phyllosticta citribraziliensis TaxID=989973 RepID=A0ABR1LY25_9PEZI
MCWTDAGTRRAGHERRSQSVPRAGPRGIPHDESDVASGHVQIQGLHGSVAVRRDAQDGRAGKGEGDGHVSGLRYKPKESGLVAFTPRAIPHPSPLRLPFGLAHLQCFFGFHHSTLYLFTRLYVSPFVHQAEAVSPDCMSHPYSFSSTATNTLGSMMVNTVSARYPASSSSPSLAETVRSMDPRAHDASKRAPDLVAVAKARRHNHHGGRFSMLDLSGHVVQIIGFLALLNPGNTYRSDEGVDAASPEARIFLKHAQCSLDS